MQKTWQLGVKWDDILPEHITHSFSCWLSSLDALKTLKGSRRISNDRIQIHPSGDASEEAYCCCVYIRIQKADSTWLCNLVYAKGV